MSCSGLTRASKNTGHLLTICTQKATRFNKGPRRSRCCGQAGYSLSCSALFFFLSCSGLTRTSMAPRNALRLPEDDNENTRHLLTICTQKATRFNKNSRRSRCCGQAGYSLRASTKIRTAAGVAVKLATACTLQQRFSPQPVLRSSWQQLARFNKDSYRSRRALKGVPLSSWLQLASRLGKQNIRRLKISDDYYKKICYIKRNRCIFSKPRRQSCLSAFRSLSG